MGKFPSLGLALALSLAGEACDGRASGAHHETSPIEPPTSTPTEAATPEDPCGQEVARIRERLERGEGMTEKQEKQAKPCLEKEGVLLI